MASWFGYSGISFHHAPTTISVPLKQQSAKAKAGEEPTTLPLSAICASVTPTCMLNPLLFNGHMHTLRAALNRANVPVHYRRHVFTSDSTYYPGQFAVDFVSRAPAPPEEPTILPRTTVFGEEDWKTMEVGSNDSKPMLVVLHGISGGSHELYLRYVIHHLVEEVGIDKASKGADDDELWINKDGEGLPSAASPTELNPNGWEAVVINARGCAKSEITSPRLFNARATWDLRQLVKWLRRSYPNRPLFALGFSLGGNILVNYLGEEGSTCQFRAAVVCSNPWNLEAGSLNLQRTWFGLNVYSKTLGANMKKLFERHVEEISKDPNINLEKVRATKYLHDFDRELQGPTWGYPTEGAYYRDASSTEPVMAVRIPLFSVHADDDPIAPLEALPFEEVKRNPYVVMCNTSMGGHLGWFELGGGRWFVRPIVNFLRSMAEDVDFDTLRMQTRASSDSQSKAIAKVKRPVFNSMRRKLDVQS